MSTVLLGVQPCVNPSGVLAYCRRQGLPTDWFGRANAFRCPLGVEPGRGAVLMTRGHFERLTLNGLHDLAFKLDRTHETFARNLPAGYSGSVTLKNLLILSSRSLTPGLAGDDNETLLVELADYRHVLAMVPCDVAYNVSSVPTGDYYSGTVSGGVTPYTWSEIASALWSLVGTATLGTYPGLPFTPEGTPRDFRFYGGRALAALGEVLERIGCAFKYDPIAGTYGIVRVGASDPTYSAWEGAWDAHRVKDSYEAVSNVGRYPAAVRVLFRKLPPPAGSSPWYAVTESPPAAYAEAGYTAATVEDIHDDLPAVYDSAGALSNAAALATRATERAGDYYRRLTSAWEPSRKRYSLPADAAGCLPGAQVASTWWGDIGATNPDFRAGLHTEVERHPAFRRQAWPKLENQSLDTYDATVHNLTATGTITPTGPTTYPPSGSPVTISGDTNDLTLIAGSVGFLNVTVAVNLTGIVAGVSGRRVLYCNTGNATLTIKNEDSGSAAANRIRTHYATYADVLLPPNFWVEFQYDASISRWRVVFVGDELLKGTDELVSFGATETDYQMDQRYPFKVVTPASGGSTLETIAFGKRGQWYWLQVAEGSDALTITHQKSGGTAGNLIDCPGKIDYVLPPCGGVAVFYDGTYWQVLANQIRPSILLLLDIDVTVAAPAAPNLFAFLDVPLTAIRTITMPAASAVKAGTTITVVDKAGNLGATNYLTIQKAGSDTVNGASSVSIKTPYSRVGFTSDGVSKWTANPADLLTYPLPISLGGTASATAPAAFDALANQGTGVAVASAATVNIGAAAGHYLGVSGTTTITAFDAANIGVWRVLVFDGALTLTHNATSLILPGGANITTAAGDRAGFTSLGSGNWRCDWYCRNSVPYATASAATASTLALRDSSANLTANNFLAGFTSTATAAGTTTLTVASTHTQVFTGTTTQTVALPVASTLVNGQTFRVVNLSTGVVTVQTSGGNTLIAMVANSEAFFQVVNSGGGTGTASWSAVYGGFTAVTGTGANVLATSPTLVTPALGTPASGVLTNCTGLPAAGLVAGVIRELLSAARTYYVRTDGSDSNTGLVNSAGGAFLTIQKAVDTVTDTLDTGGYAVTISVGSGTFTGATVLAHILGGGTCAIVGAGLASTIISTTSATCFSGNGFGSGWSITDLKMTTTTSGNCISVTDGAVSFQDVAFGACATNHINVFQKGSVTASGNYTINGNAAIHASVSRSGSSFTGTSNTVTLSGTPAWSTSGLNTSLGGVVNINGVTYSGSATGTRYAATTNSVIFTNGGGANFFPGNAAGSTASGAQYV